MNMNSKEKIRVLCKFFGWADMMREYFQREMEAPTDSIIGNRNNDRALIFMASWYGLLSTVIDGWKKAKFGHDMIDKALKSSRVKSLKKYYQKVLKISLNNHRKKNNALLLEGLNKAPLANKIHDKIGIQLRKYLWS